MAMNGSFPRVHFITFLALKAIGWLWPICSTELRKEALKHATTIGSVGGLQSTLNPDLANIFTDDVDLWSALFCQEQGLRWWKWLVWDSQYWSNDWWGIDQKYGSLVLLLHPDRNSYPGAADALNLITDALTVLSDREKMKSFDSKLEVVARSWGYEMDVR